MTIKQIYRKGIVKCIKELFDNKTSKSITKEDFIYSLKNTVHWCEYTSDPRTCYLYLTLDEAKYVKDNAFVAELMEPYLKDILKETVMPVLVVGAEEGVYGGQIQQSSKPGYEFALFEGQMLGNSNLTMTDSYFENKGMIAIKFNMTND